jgi:hypothetical protein
MRSFLISCALLLSSLTAAPTKNFISRDLLVLLEAMDVPNDGTAQSIVAATQKQWLRPKGKERWEVADTLTPEQRKAVIKFYTKNGFFNEVSPQRKSYDYVLVLGATVSRMEKRLDYLDRLYEKGIRFKQVILLTGARPLDPEVESIPPGCKTEGEALDYLWKSMKLSKQVAWKYFECPMVTLADGKEKRPNRAEAFQFWLKTSPPPGTCLLISNQPYCHYEQALAQNVLPKEMKFEVVGPKADPASQNGNVMLDNLARWIYESSKN